MTEMEFDAVRHGLERFNLSQPLTPEQMAEVYPYILRSIPSVKVEDVIHCEPQPGEYDRFGVYFYALRALDDLNGLRLSPERTNILLPTAESLAACKIKDEILQRGIVAQPSAYAKKVQEEAAEAVKRLRPTADPKSYSFWMDVGRRVNESNMVLDYGLVKVGRHPIFTVPTAMDIQRDMMLPIPQL